MANVEEILEMVNRFLLGEVSLDSFEDWSSEFSWNIHEKADAETQRLAYLVQSKIGQFGEGEIDEESFLRDLANVVHPFAQSRLTPQAR